LKVKENYDVTITTETGETYQGHLGDTLMIEDAFILIQLNEELLKEKKTLQIAGDYIFSVLSMYKLISQISSNLDIIAVDKDVPVIRISYKSSHPFKAALFPNALAEAYIADYIENKFSAANVTVDFLNERISEISEKLNESEQMILNYRNTKSITNIIQETETELRKISQLKIQQTNLKMTLEAMLDLENYIQTGKDNFLELAPNFEAFTDLLSTEIIKNIKQLQAEKKDLLLQYTKKDEKVIVVDAKINDLTSYLIESITNTRKNIQTKYDKLVTDIEQAEKVFISVPEKERMMTILNREFEIIQQSYNFLNQKKIEAEIAKAAKIAFHRVITPALPSHEPVSPNRVIIKIVAAILGMTGAITFIFIVHAMKARVNDLATVESNSMIPIAAAVPKLKSKEEKENFFIKTLAEWEVKGLFLKNSITCFTAFHKSHGVNFLAWQLANVLSMQERSVLFIEVVENTEELPFSFEETSPMGDFIDGLLVPAALLKKRTTKAWQDLLREKTTAYDYVLLLNTVFNDTHTIAGMAAADLNIVCLDTRLTPANLIAEVDLIKQEYQLPKMHFAVNRIGYNPSLFGEAIQFVKRLSVAVQNKKQK
jgi:capsular polysaccharide biosynthesis protein